MFKRIKSSRRVQILTLAGSIGLLAGAVALSLGTDSAHGIADKTTSQSPGIKSQTGLPNSAIALAPKADHILSQTRSGGLPATIAELQALQRQDPSNLTLANQLAVLWAAAGDLDKSREALEQALASHPDAATAFINLRELASQQFAQAYAKAIGQTQPASRLTLEAGGLELASVKDASAVYQRAEAEKKALELAQAKMAAEQLALERAANESAKWKESSPRTPAQASIVTFGSPKDTELVVRILKQWAKAWASKDFQQYADFYSSGFKTAQFASKQVWLDYRRPRIVGKGNIVVELDGIRVEFISEHRARASFNQRYESGSLRLNTRKNVALVFEDNTWRIQSEGN